MRDAGRRDAAERARAEELSARLSAPPGFFMRMWMTGATLTAVLLAILLLVWVVVGVAMCIGVLWKEGLPAFVAAVVLGLILAVPLVYNEVLHDLARPLHTDWADALGGAGSYALLGLAFYLVLAVPLLLGDFAASFESVREALQRILAARPPRMPGGPAECRRCGAALEVRPGELHARCLYCASDNLVEVPESTAKKAKEQVKAEHRDVASAYAAERRARRQGLRDLFAGLGKWAALIPVLVLLGRAVAAINDDSGTFWRRAVPGSPMRANVSDNPPIARGQSTPFTGEEDLRPLSHRVRGLLLHAPRPRREADHHRDPGQAPGGPRAGEGHRPLVRPTYVWKDIDLSGGAPYTGWYRVVLVSPRSLGDVEPRVTWDAAH